MPSIEIIVKPLPFPAYSSSCNNNFLNSSSNNKLTSVSSKTSHALVLNALFLLYVYVELGK